LATDTTVESSAIIVTPSATAISVEGFAYTSNLIGEHYARWARRPDQIDGQA